MGHPSHYFLIFEIIIFIEMSLPKITRKSHGPILVVGEVDLTDEAGNPIEHNPRFSLCGCGKSEKMPFCDGAHKEA